MEKEPSIKTMVTERLHSKIEFGIVHFYTVTGPDHVWVLELIQFWAPTKRKNVKTMCTRFSLKKVCRKRNEMDNFCLQGWKCGEKTDLLNRFQALDIIPSHGDPFTRNAYIQSIPECDQLHFPPAANLQHSRGSSWVSAASIQLLNVSTASQVAVTQPIFS